MTWNDPDASFREVIGLRADNVRLRELLRDAYNVIKYLRDSGRANNHQDEYERLVDEIAPHLNLPTFESVRGILHEGDDTDV